MQLLRERIGEEVQPGMTPELPADEEPPADEEIPDITETSTDVEQT